MQILKLHTTNAEQLVYDNGLLILTVLGGVKLEGLDLYGPARLGV